MIELDWKAIAAVWGAGLSTFLAVKNWISNSPLMILEPASMTAQSVEVQYFMVRIKNTTSKPIQINKVRLHRPSTARVWLHQSQKSYYGDRTDNFVIYPEQQEIVKINLSGFDCPLMMTLTWRFMDSNIDIPRFRIIYRTKGWMANARKMNIPEFRENL